MADRAIENLTLHNINLQITRPFDFSERRKHEGGTGNPHDDRITLYARQPSYCTLANVNNVVVDNLRVDAAPEVLDKFPRSALAVFHARGAVLRSIARSGPAHAPVVELHEVRGGLVTGCIASPGTEVFARTHGMEESEDRKSTRLN